MKHEGTEITRDTTVMCVDRSEKTMGGRNRMTCVASDLLQRKSREVMCHDVKSYIQSLSNTSSASVNTEEEGWLLF